MICKLNKNINSDFCPSLNHGIKKKVYLFNRNDISGLNFYRDRLDTDTRVDSSTYISSISTSEPFYTIVGNVVTYTEQRNGDNYNHTLTITINTKDYSIDEILYMVKNNKYFVVFEAVGEDNARGFGWGEDDEGAEISSSLNISETEDYYTLTITQTTEYPLFSVSKDALDLSKMVFAGNFVPDFVYNIQCKIGLDGDNNGYIMAMTAPYVNSAGQALDRDGHLSEYSGKKQAAKVRNDYVTSEYDIIDTYTVDAVVDGYYTTVYNSEACELPITGSISVTPNTIELFPNNGYYPTVNVKSSAPWKLDSEPTVCNITPSEGYDNTNVTVMRYDGGNETLVFRNRATDITAELKVYSYTLYSSVKSLMIDEAGTYTVDVLCKGGTNVGFTVSADTSLAKNIIVNDNSFTFTVDNVSQNAIINFTIKHKSTDRLSIKVVAQIITENKTPQWVIVSEECEVVGGVNNGYINYIYTDTNPSSPSYGQYKNERLYDKVKCPTSDADWVLQGEYCETDTSGGFTGYKVFAYQDMNPLSVSYGEWFYRKELSADCPTSSKDPIWEVYSRNCQQKEYGEGLIDNSGYEQIVEEDVNPYSLTYGTRRARLEYNESLCPIPNKTPNWEIVSEECEINDGYQTGNIIKNERDTNPYSDTYNQGRYITEKDEVKCPISYPYIHQYSKTDTRTVINLNLKSDVDVILHGYSARNDAYQTVTAEKTEGELLFTIGPIQRITETNRNYRFVASPFKATVDEALPYKIVITQTLSGKELIYQGYIIGLKGTDAVWRAYNSYCQIDTSGNNTGYLITYERDVNPLSPTYGEERANLVENNVQCPSAYKFQSTSDDSSNIKYFRVSSGWYRQGFAFYSAVNNSPQSFSVYEIEADEGCNCTFYNAAPSSSTPNCNYQVWFDFTMDTVVGKRITIKLRQDNSGKVMTFVLYNG